MPYQPHHLLVTGAAGFIGSHFVREQLKQYPDIQIISYDLLTYAGSLENLSEVMDNPRHTFIQADIADNKALLETLQTHQIDTIVHFAAETHVDNSIAGPEVFFQTNVIGTQRLLETAKNYWKENNQLKPEQCRFHHISTDEVYGSLAKDEPAFTELNPYQPNSPYSASKAGSDHIVRAYHHTYNLPVTMTMCSNNFGPNQHAEKLIPIVIDACLNQKIIPIYGDGSNIRDWLFVTDHCKAIDRVIREGTIGENYNIGGNNELSNLDLIQQICQQMDALFPQNEPHDQLIEFVQDRPGHDWRYAIDSSKIENTLGWKPMNTVEKALSETIQSYGNNRP